MKRIITVASVQMGIIPHSIEGNISKIYHLLGQACQTDSIDLAVLPEDCFMGPLPSHLEYAVDESSDTITKICNIAKDFKIYLVAGSIIMHDKGKYYNVSMLIDPSGEILTEYKKVHLWHPEQRYLTAGAEVAVAQTPIGTIGLAICWDLAFPKLFQKMMAAGVDIVCIPSYWTTSDAGSLIKINPNAEATIIDSLCPARAIENGCLVVYANGAGRALIPLKAKTISLDQVGHSQICAPVLGVVAKAADNNEQVIVYKYDRGIGKKAEDVYRLRKDNTP